MMFPAAQNQQNAAQMQPQFIPGLQTAAQLGTAGRICEMDAGGSSNNVNFHVEQ